MMMMMIIIVIILIARDVDRYLVDDDDRVFITFSDEMIDCV